MPKKKGKRSPRIVCLSVTFITWRRLAIWESRNRSETITTGGHFDWQRRMRKKWEKSHVRQPGFPAPTPARKKVQLKIGRQFISNKFARIIRGFPTRCRRTILEKRNPPCFISRVPRPTKPCKLSKLTENSNVLGDHFWMLAKGISASCLGP